MSGKKKNKGSCPSCGAPSRRKRQLCRMCLAAIGGGVGKAAGGPAFLGKAYGGGAPVTLMTKGAQPSTWPCPSCGHHLGRSATSCSRCGRIGGPGALKSAAAAARFLSKSASGAVGERCPSCFRPQDPGARYSHCCARLLPGSHPMIAKSQALARTWDREFWNEHDPGRREMLRRLMHGDTGGAA